MRRAPFLRALSIGLLATGTVVGLAAAAAPASNPELDKVMTALAERKHGHVTFTEKKFIAVVDRPGESSGELFYDAPDRLEKRTLKPKPESLVLAGGEVSVQRGKHHYVLDLKQYPQVVPFIESIRATLAGDRVALESTFHVSFGGSFQDWTLGLVPADAQLIKTVKEIHIEGAQDRVHTVEIREADGDRSLLTIGPEIPQ
jgi:hypothetical protein